MANVSELETRRFPVDQLREFCTRVFVHFEVRKDDAQLAADVLTTSDLRGIDSHGIARLPMYFEHFSVGRLNPGPRLQVLRETPSTATIDGDNGLGLLVAPKANEIAMEKAADVGSGWVSVCNSNHFGIASYGPLQAIQRDMIGWAMTNASSQVVPLWSSQRMLGTNPLAIAFPSANEPPIVIDMATSVVAYGKIEIAQRKNKPIPDGWALDANGNTTNDPWDATGLDYALLPLGGDHEHGGHKGYCLGSMVDILCGVLSGAAWGPFAPNFFIPNPPVETPVGRGLGHFFGAMRVDGFMEPDDFKKRMDHWSREFRAAKAAPGTDGPLVPGLPEWEAAASRSQDGIPLDSTLVSKLREVSQHTGVPWG